MAKGSQLVFYCVWAICVMMLTCGSAEREYFPQDTNATWAVARNHCKVCFKELVTLTPDNGPFIVRYLSSEYWVGLRKRPVNASDNSTLFSFNDTTLFWSRWANGDPLTFQNWYPGYPVFKSPYPKQECCSCSCTCPSQPTPRPTTIITQNVTPTTSTNSTVTTNSTDSSQKTTNDGQNTTAYTSRCTNYSVENTRTPVSVESSPVQSTRTPVTVKPDYSAENTSTPVSVEPSSVQSTRTPVTVKPDYSAENTSAPVSVELSSVQSTSTSVTVEPDYFVKNSTSFNTIRGTHLPIPNATTVLATTTESTSQWTTSFTSAAPVTHTPMVSECDRRPMLFQDVPDLDKNYIEDSCVAILSFGAWVEKTCSDHLPFICYEDKFFGEVNVTDITTTSATLKWEKAPGDIDHYRVAVNHLQYDDITTDLTISVRNLTAGTRYKVEVFPVKCGRDLNSENGTFYTVPNKVSDLQIVSVTENCVSLVWNKSSGNVDRYSIITRGQTPCNVTEPNATLCDLTPGSLHSFNVQAGFSDWSTWSFNSTISAYTKPAKVSNLQTENIAENSLSFVWDKPKGDATSYLARWSYSNGGQAVSDEDTVAENKLEIKSLPSGTKITLSVTALANYSLQGESQTVENFTLPEKVSGLTLKSTENTISATWEYTAGSPNFTVELLYDNEKIKTVDIVTTAVQFNNLTSAANYNVTVYSVSGITQSRGVSKSIFTLPVTPRDPVLSNKNKTHLTFSWTPPPNTKTVDYVVSLNSTFWKFDEEENLNNVTMHTFGPLTSGSSYSFKIQTRAGTLRSAPITLTAWTDPALKEITLSMVCSSVQPLHCDAQKTRDSALEKLTSTFKSVLGDSVHWELKKMEGANTGN